MLIHLNTQADLENAVHALVKQDPRLKPVFDIAGMPALRRREPGFAGLAHIICGQQLSTASAAAIWGRISAAFDPFDHEALRRARADRLGRLGLSAAKIKTLKALAREIAAERLNLDVLANEDADAAHNTLTALHGIGPWTADVYLLFCLGVAGGRSRRPGGHQDRAWAQDAADRQTDGAARRAMAAAARRRGASVVELLPRDQETRRRDRQAELIAELIIASR
jgi:endonuclease III